uniref:KIB1-4 beta-propeller domain-containing protein n=1 Tax=Oryza meridionalis TaxID=40149 RepID=A0A0E0CUT0_9ORYZ
MAVEPSPSIAAAYPLLVQRSNADGQPGSPAMAYSLPDGKTHDDVSLPEMHSNTFLETPQGWVLVLSSSPTPKTTTTTFLLDPRDGRKVGLPPLDENELPTGRKCVLSDSAPDAGAGVVVLSLQGPAVWFCRVGGERWSTHTYDMGYFSLPEEYCAPQEAAPVRRRRRRRREVLLLRGQGLQPRHARLHRRRRAGAGRRGRPRRHRRHVPLPRLERHAATYLVESRGDLYLAAVVFLGFRAEGPPHQFSV